MSLDLSMDFLVVDDAVLAKYQVKTAESTYASSVDVPYAARSAITQEDLLQNPALLQVDSMVWHVWRRNLTPVVGPTIIPKKGDKIWQDNDGTGYKWLVIRVQFMDQDANGIQRFRLTCTRFKTVGE